MVYVIGKSGQPLMPTKNHCKVRDLLKHKQAKVVRREPFTIQLLHTTHCYKQPITLGIDAGSKTVGVSATTAEAEVYAAEVRLRSDVKELLDTRREARRARRNRKTRYRKPRFNNRVRPEGWLAPSVKQKIQTHLREVEFVTKILPITNIVVEAAAFDTQLLKAQDDGVALPKGDDYQHGTLYGYNLREYVLHRDNHTCQWCHGKSGCKSLHTHHWNFWNGDHSNKPSSLITLCSVCNDSKNHKPEAKMLYGWKPSITNNYSDAAFMTIMRWKFYETLKSQYRNVSMTFGYLTKMVRIENHLPKEHCIDARCISGNPKATPLDCVYYKRAMRRHNRQIHKFTPKHGKRQLNQAPKYVFDRQLFDKVRMPSGQIGFIFGRRSSGSFDIRTLDGHSLSKGISCQKLKFIESRKTILTERRNRNNSEIAS